MAAIEYDLLFRRLGRQAHVGYRVNQRQAELPALVSAWAELYEDTADDDLVGNLLTTQKAVAASASAPPAVASGLGTTTLVRAVATSAPSVAKTPQAALSELIRQMLRDGETVRACAVSASAVALSGNTGDGVVVITTKRGDGLVQENLVAETLRLQCVADSYTGGATVGREQFRLAGVTNSAGQWDYDWPNGSSAAAGVAAVSADQEGSTATNLLTNGAFESWTADADPELENWTLETGTWGTDVQQSSDAYRGDFAVEFVAGTGANTALYQQFDDGTDGTGAGPSALTSYVHNFRIKRAGVVSAGVLTVELIDGSGTVVNDQQGVANSTTITLSGLTTSYAASNVVFRLPEVPPDVLRIRYRMSTALAGANVLIDDAGFVKPTPAYAGGFSFAVFSGATPFVAQDGWDVTATNDRAGAEYGATWQTWFDRQYGMRNFNLLLPSSATPTIPDSLITFPGIVGYYRFQNALTDSSGNGNDLTDSAATYGAGKIGQGLTGGAGTRAAAFATLAGLAIGTPVSISFWVNVPALGAGAVTGSRAGWTTDTWYVQAAAADASVGYGIAAPGRAAVDGELPVSAWAHVVWTWDGTDAHRLYLNGTLLDDWTQTPTTANYNGAFSAAADVAAMGTDLDELLIADRVLSQEDVTFLYNDGDGLDPTD